MSIQLCAYLSYNGDCAKAMAFYAQVLGAKLEALITCPTATQARRVFNALAEGGKVGMPLAETFWANTFGMVPERFSTP